MGSCGQAHKISSLTSLRFGCDGSQGLQEAATVLGTRDVQRRTSHRVGTNARAELSTTQSCVVHLHLQREAPGHETPNRCFAATLAVNRHRELLASAGHTCASYPPTECHKAGIRRCRAAALQLRRFRKRRTRLGLFKVGRSASHPRPSAGGAQDVITDAKTQ